MSSISVPIMHTNPSALDKLFLLPEQIDAKPS